MTATTGYSVVNYGEMITDQPRLEAYSRALEQSIKPGCSVVDIGCGTGVFSLLACRFGAARVDAFEPESAIQIARSSAAANGFADRIVFHQKVSSDVALAHRADVIVSDLRGVLPLFQRHIPAIIDARTRMLAPGGRLIPRCDSLFAALVEAPDVYRNRLQPWLHNRFDLDLSAGHEPVVNSWSKARLKPDELLAPGRPWATVDYRVVDDPNVRGGVEWILEQDGIGHGLAFWFDADLGDGIGFSNAPGEPESIYGQAFFPWPQAVELTAGDSVRVDLRADLVGSDYTWRWRTDVRFASEKGKAPLEFDQSTFFGQVLALDMLRREEAGHAPQLTLEGRMDAFMLSRMDGETTLEEIAKDASEQFSEHFSDWKAALTKAGELSVKYGK